MNEAMEKMMDPERFNLEECPHCGGSGLVDKAVRAVSSREYPIIAVINQNFTLDFKRYFEWANTSDRKWHGKFNTVEEAAAAIPKEIKNIRVDITDEDGKRVSYTINRD